jgi:hypothetical protein
MKSIDYCIIVLLLSVFLITIATELIKKKETFVAWNNEEVRQESPYGLIREDERVVRTFNQIVQEDANKFSGKSFNGFRDTTTFEEEIKGVIHYILSRINKTGNRRFVGLDTISVKKEQTLDPDDRRIVNKWTVNLFITEKNKLNVHGWTMLISFTLLQKDQVMKIEKLYTITDHFYKKPLVEGLNPYDKYYKIENPLHLTKPWKTSAKADGNDVLMSEQDTEELLNQWHKDLKTPQYKCFMDSGLVYTPKEGKGFYAEQGDRYKSRKECEAKQGTWDKPVENDNECPFYRANKHYPNRLGGVKLQDNRCEMPINTKTIGYRYVSSDPAHKPMCYNCKNGLGGPGSIGACCDEQLDVELYPELGGNPDYAFPGDELERYQHRDVLAQRGLNWQRYPTHIRNIENKNQKQPVFNAIVGQGPGKINLP